MAVKRGFWYQLSLAVVPLFYNVISRTLFATCRTHEHGRHHLAACEKQPAAFIAAFWHYSVLYIIHRSRHKSWVAMVSASRDAEYVAKILDHMGCETVRGSRSRGGLSSLKRMITLVKNGKNAAIVADGSQGPPRQVQAGVILLASKTGVPILPVIWGADRYFAFKSWDRTLLPKPFARIGLWYGEPLSVPGKLKSADLQIYRRNLEERLNNLYSMAWHEFGRKEH